MASSQEKKDNWSSEAYQSAASFVPKLATKIVQWLDPKKDDVIIDIGCGDGVLDFEIAQVFEGGRGRLHGVDSSKAMIEAAQKKAVGDAKLRTTCSFEVLDATALISKTHLHYVRFNKAFSNAALHWILRPEDKREVFFQGVRNVLAPGGTFAFEMGGLGNVSEIRAALVAVVGKRVGLKRAQEVDPWFFPDEEWIKQMMEEKVGGWKVENIEREWRPTNADVGGVEGWVRLMAAQFLQALGSEEEREEVVKEVVDVLEIVCAKPGGGYMYSYVRLRVLARKV